jgi:hypothetical protein
MKFFQRYFQEFLIVVMLLISSPTLADREDSIRALFTWAEENHSELFAPSPATIQRTPPWIYTYYPQTNTYVGVNDKDEVWVLGDVFGGMLYIDTLCNLLDTIGYEKPENCDCVNVPLVSKGSRIVVNIKFVSGSNTVRDITYTDVSISQFTVDEITTISFLGTTTRSEGSITVSQTITDNRAFINSTEAIINTGVDTSVITTEYSPAQARGPILTYCKGETWTEPSVKETVTINGDVTTKQTTSAEGIVNSVNDSISIPAGNFSTVMMTTTSISTVHKEWRDIATGHIVKITEYDGDGTTLRWTWEATLIE